MKLREFIPAKIEKSPKHTKAYMLISLRYGLLQLSGAATTLIGAKAGNCVSFHQDEEEPESWYLELLPEGSEGFPLRSKTKPGVKGLLFASKPLAKRIADSSGMETEKGRVNIAHEPISVDGKILWVLVTASLKPKRLD